MMSMTFIACLLIFAGIVICVQSYLVRSYVDGGLGSESYKYKKKAYYK